MNSPTASRILLGCAYGLVALHALPAATFNIADGDLGALSIAIQQANINNADDIINLAAGGLYTAVGPFSGTDALPALGSDNNHSLIINGNGATLRRSTIAGTPNFRLLAVAMGGRATIERLTVTNGRLASGSGAGITNFGNLTLTNCFVSGNTISSASSGAGGGVMNNPNAMLTVSDSIITGNTVSATTDARGGGIYNFSSLVNAATVKRSTISGNMVSSTGTARGGGIYTRGVLTLINGTLSGNSASGPGGGGGIYQHAFGGEPLTLVNSTLANNSASGGGQGGGIYDGSAGGLSTVSALNTILATNTATTGPDVFQGAGPIASQGHNLIGKTDGSSGWIASDLTGTNAMPLDPMLGALESNFMHPLLAGSPALEAADDAVLTAPHNSGHGPAPGPAPNRGARGYRRLRA